MMPIIETEHYGKIILLSLSALMVAGGLGILGIIPTAASIPIQGLMLVVVLAVGPEPAESKYSLGNNSDPDDSSSSSSSDGEKVVVPYDEWPDTCHLCGEAIDTDLRSQFTIHKGEDASKTISIGICDTHTEVLGQVIDNYDEVVDIYFDPSDNSTQHSPKGVTGASGNRISKEATVQTND